MKVLKCERCGKIVVQLDQKPCPTMCCGEAMKELIPNTTDAAVEKHVPVVEQEGNTVTVKVGSVTHPMVEAHYIQFIALVTKNGVQYKALTPEDEPKAVFALVEGDEVVNAYEYCNLHGFWAVK
ncbi:MAG: desulfoferrodoxin Dfx [Erysipelotrichaceae bacterium]|nr:desulfoferrodoxin Dfx [Erysipelotrichaceae bacterium]